MRFTPFVPQQGPPFRGLHPDQPNFGQAELGDGFRSLGQRLDVSGSSRRLFWSLKWLLSKPFWDPILVGIGEVTTQFRTDF